MEGPQAADLGLIMRKLKEFELDRRAVAHLRQRINDLLGYARTFSGLCPILEEALSSNPGRVTTFAPQDAKIERLHEFEAGGLLPENLDFSRATKLEDGSAMIPVASLVDAKQQRLASVLRQDRELVCLAVDPLPRKGDPAPKLWSTTFFVDDEVYQLCTSETSDEDFERALFASPPWCDLQIVSRARPFVDADRSSTVAELRKCANATIELWCCAYDGEGFLRWRAA